MAQPNLLQLKRKRTDEPLEHLLLQGVKTGDADKHYIRQKATNGPVGDRGPPKSSHQSPSTPSAGLHPPPKRARREFQLQASVKRKRDGGDDDIATFVEKKKSKQTVGDIVDQSDATKDVTTAEPLKRPGKGSTLRGPPQSRSQAEPEADRTQMEALATYMHNAALDEIKRSTPTKPVAAPKLSGARSKEIHRRRTATNGSVKSQSDMELDDEDSYVYDTYVLAPTTDMGAVQADELGQLDNVGYLVITEDDRSLWETYLEEEPSDKDWNSDEDDENAEGYYGADYPDEEEELDHDDLHWDAYLRRSRGLLNEEVWDEDAQAYSDDEDALMKGTTPRRFRKYLDEHDAESD